MNFWVELLNGVERRRLVPEGWKPVHWIVFSDNARLFIIVQKLGLEDRFYSIDMTIELEWCESVEKIECIKWLKAVIACKILWIISDLHADNREDKAFSKPQKGRS